MLTHIQFSHWYEFLNFFSLFSFLEKLQHISFYGQEIQEINLLNLMQKCHVFFSKVLKQNATYYYGCRCSSFSDAATKPSIGANSLHRIPRNKSSHLKWQAAWTNFWWLAQVAKDVPIHMQKDSFLSLYIEEYLKTVFNCFFPSDDPMEGPPFFQNELCHSTVGVL